MNSINPNSIYEEGIPLPENYIIYANLEVKLTKRSILVSDGDGNFSSSQRTFNISFLNSDLSKNEQTTNWTNELINNEKVNDETFGMTDIQIKFDKNNIPRVTIQFVDIRGASLIGQGNNSPYNAFFSLPYPEFLLTIKGYYGKPVTYSLSLLDFSSRYNSQNGNFEITCEFVGFTYAKLTDIPAAYILYAKDINGQPKLDENGEELPYLRDFIENIGTLNEQIDTLKNDETTKEIENLRPILDRIVNWKGEYERGWRNRDFYSNETYIKGNEFWKDLKILNEYGIEFPYTKENFSLRKNRPYTTKQELPPYAFYQNTKITYISGGITIPYLSIELQNQFTTETFEIFKDEKFGEVTKSFQKLIDDINIKLNNNKDIIADKINNLAKKTLGRIPTIKYVFDIILSDTEIFLNKLREVAISAEKENQSRLEIFSGVDSDIPETKKNKNVFPFPAYYIKDEQNNEYKHEYLGNNDKVKQNRNFFPELDFTERFIIFQKNFENTQRQNNLLNPESGWFPISPLESVYYFNGNNPLSPYSNITNVNELLDKIIDRYVILLSSFLSNEGNDRDNLKNELEIQLAKIELSNLLLSFPENSNEFKTLLKNIKTNGFYSKIIERIKLRQVINYNGTDYFVNINPPIIGNLVLDDNIESKILNLDNESVSSNITDNNLNSLISQNLNIFKNNFVSPDRNIVIDDKSKLPRLLLDYKNFIQKPSLINEGKSTFDDNLNPLNLEEINIKKDFYNSVIELENLYGVNGGTSIYFLNNIYKINWEEITNILTNFAGVIELPYFTVLQIGSILWDNFNNNNFNINNIENLFDISYNAIINDLSFYINNREVFINEFLNFDFNEIFTEFFTTQGIDDNNSDFLFFNKNQLIKFKNFLKEKRILINPSYRLWKNPNTELGYYSNNVSFLYQPLIYNRTNESFEIEDILKNAGEIFFRTFESELKTKIDTIEKEQKSNFNELLKEFNDYKLETYNSFKSLYDRWIANTSSDFNLRKDFIYINRFYKDIGDILVINPQSLTNLFDNPKTPLYSIISNLLSENKLDFHPLPAFINNFNPENDKLAKEMFGQYNTIENVITEPKFICMYVGGTSKYIINDKVGNVFGDFLNDSPDKITPKDYNDEIEVINYKPFSFDVEIGSQTQSHFKDLQFDQKQFKVTNESLQAQENIANSSNTRKGLLTSQSLYSVYLQYSYSCTVTGLGNALIQPLLYFRIPNIPLINGYYLIINVEHSITPNFMETKFTGVRISNATIPIVKSYFETLGISDSSGSNQDNVNPTENGWIKQLKELNIV